MAHTIMRIESQMLGRSFLSKMFEGTWNAFRNLTPPRQVHDAHLA